MGGQEGPEFREEVCVGDVGELSGGGQKGGVWWSWSQEWGRETDVRAGGR